MAKEIRKKNTNNTSEQIKKSATDSKRIKGFRLLIVSLILVIGSAFYAGWAKQSTYQQSKIIGAELTSVKSSIKSIEKR